MKNFISNDVATPRMFKNAVVEFFSRTHWTVPLWIYVPLVSLWLWLSIPRLSTGVLIGLVVAGIAFWTLLEYVLHRFVFHYHPSSALGKRLMWILHGVHHDYPRDPLRLVMPPSISLPLAAFFYGLLYLIVGNTMALPILSGMTIGYLFYDISHYAIHHFPIKGNYFGTLREYHLRHHFRHSEQGFGVSSPFWDYVFGTHFKSSKAPTETHNA
jgi:sterol desaturase/sphingolipid hydroxylase (fatty acid hydroxylase superfamily)